MALQFRPIADQDQPFLLELYGTTRAAELAMLPWSQQQKEEFVQMQFHAQHTFYQQQFGNAKFDLLLKHDKPIGRLYVDRREDEIRIIDIAIMPDYQRQGIGSQLLQELLDESKASAKPVTIHVEKNNPALGLYQRLGFEQLEDQGVYWLMRWSA